MSETAKVVLITGGAKGIGEGCTRAFFGAGWNVVIGDYDEKTATVLASELNARGPGRCHVEPGDVRQTDDIERWVESAVKKFGRLDCLINNAGWHPPHSPIDGFSIKDFTDLIQWTLTSVFAGCKYALPHLRKTRGSIINISSLVATLGQEWAVTYCAAKGGVCAITRALAIDEARHGVRVNTVLPGNIYTPQRVKSVNASADPEALHNYIESTQWMGRSGTIDEAGQTCLFLASDSASYITGIDLILSGGSELGYGPKVPSNG